MVFTERQGYDAVFGRLEFSNLHIIKKTVIYDKHSQGNDAASNTYTFS